MEQDDIDKLFSEAKTDSSLEYADPDTVINKFLSVISKAHL